MKIFTLHKTADDGRTDQFAAWKSELQKRIVDAIRKAMSEGTVSMSIDNLQMMVRPPNGGPSGTNVQYYYKHDWFPEAAAAVAKKSPSFRQFIEGNPNRIAAVKRYKKRPKSRVGIIDNMYTPPNWSHKMDPRCNEPTRYVLQNDFPILFKEAAWPYSESGDVATRYLKSITEEWQLFKDRISGNCTRIHNLRAPLQMFLDLCSQTQQKDLRMQAPPELKDALTQAIQVLNKMESNMSPAEDLLIGMINQQLGHYMKEIFQLLPQTKRIPVPIGLKRPAPAGV